MFINNKLNGYGRIIYDGPNSSYYEGNFINHKKHGYGVRVNNDSSVQIGLWKNDIFIEDTAKKTIQY